MAWTEHQSHCMTMVRFRLCDDLTLEEEQRAICWQLLLELYWQNGLCLKNPKATISFGRPSPPF